MNFETFFHMGGYALYVWTSYGLALAVLAINLILPLRRKAQLLESLERAQRQESRKQAGRTAAEENAA
ncbi:heme exporter protein CcmD [Methylogaea oryzae]|uniref:Heme exporter protein D n=1 Tax=Methylogaea oryzae TaxID=1295382 RepID=A0A8D4VLK2_9GAMM|nr:heme exporter protein CcmD [Methylogaea oryzae]BBL69489.1 hypothetical protein MoryE10_00950 [Methylogaea oryzae]